MPRPLLPSLCLFAAACGASGSSSSTDGDTEGDEIELACPTEFAAPEPGIGRATQGVIIDLGSGPADDLCAEFEGSNAGALLADDGEIQVQILRPADANGDWPPGQFPVVVFTHGVGQSPIEYEHLWDTLVPRGVIVANVETSAAPVGHDVRAAHLRCVARYLAQQWEERGRLNCELTYAGHSSGATGAFWAAQEHAGNGSAELEVRGVWAIAPADVSTSMLDAQVDFLAIQGSVDDQTAGKALAAYERTNPDANEVGTKIMVWAYDVEHDAFGGGAEFFAQEYRMPLPPTVMRQKGEAVAVAYVDAFMRATALRENGEIEAVLRGDLMPGSLEEPSWWDYLPANPDERPMVFVAHRSGPDIGHRKVDAMDRATPGALGPSSEGYEVLTNPESFADSVTQGLVGDLASGTDAPTEALRIDWSATDFGTVAWHWDLADSPSLGATHLSVRVANVTEVEADASGACPVTQEFGPTSFTIALSDGTTTAAVRTEDDLDQLVPTQDYYPPALSEDGPPGLCLHSQFMRTIDVPMAEFCALGVDPDEAIELRFRFGPVEGADEGSVLIDSIEFRTRPESQSCN